MVVCDVGGHRPDTSLGPVRGELSASWGEKSGEKASAGG